MASTPTQLRRDPTSTRIYIYIYIYSAELNSHMIFCVHSS